MIKEIVVFKMKQSENYLRPPTPPLSRGIIIPRIDHRLAQTLIKLHRYYIIWS